MIYQEQKIEKDEEMSFKAPERPSMVVPFSELK